MNPRKRASTCTASLAWAVLLLLSPAALAEQQAPAPAAASPPAAASAEPAADPRLLQIKYICVERFGNDPLGVQAQEMVIARLFEAKRFRLTENCEKADYTLKGSITERSDRTSRSESEGLGFTASGSARVTTGSGQNRESTAASSTARGNDYESLSSSEVKVQAAVTLRVVDREGEILWAASLESTGGKTKGAINDAAERAVRRLLRDIERAEKQKDLPR